MTEEGGRKVVKERLGPQYDVVRLSGYWVIGDGSGTREPGSRASFGRVSPEPLRRSLKLAISDVENGR